VGANFVVKLAVRRQRPKLRRLPPLAGAPSQLSFPSAHAASSFAGATAMGRVSPGARVPLYALAATICLTRPYLGMHYPSDVLGGVALGLLIGRLWPGVRPPDAEDRLIDLAGAARGTTR
jgi:undecaprenyl-diphosphatase